MKNEPYNTKSILTKQVPIHYKNTPPEIFLMSQKEFV